jgi:hypothetical protein
MYVLGSVCLLGGQGIQIGIIDFYGLRNVSADHVRRALTFKEGDTVSEDRSSLKETENRLATLPGVVRARTAVVCCDQGRAIVYIGIEERGASALTLRAAPSGAERLAPDIVQAGEDASNAFKSAVQRGDAAEDRTKGHALAHDPATRRIQERFIVYATRDLAGLRSVLRNSSDASHRALAAQLIGYAPDKQAVVEDLAQGMRDPSEAVRNSAMRALMVFAEAAPITGGTRLQIPWRPFIEFLTSPVWSDRNKASGALMTLSASRDPALLEMLRRDALVPLVEMARWKSAGHAYAAFIILARIAGYSDESANDHWSRGDREIVIKAALKS